VNSFLLARQLDRIERKLDALLATDAEFDLVLTQLLAQQHAANRLGGRAVDVARDVGVEVGRDLDGGVSDARGQDFHGHPGGQSGGDVGMAQVVDAGGGQTGPQGDLGAPVHDGGGGAGEDAPVYTFDGEWTYRNGMKFCRGVYWAYPTSCDP
jgi:hypothetical protein